MKEQVSSAKRFQKGDFRSARRAHRSYHQARLPANRSLAFLNPGRKKQQEIHDNLHEDMPFPRGVPNMVAGLYFWGMKALALMLIWPVSELLFWLGDQSWRGLLAAILFTIFAIGWTFKDGLSREQWRYNRHEGTNLVVRYFGQGLHGFSIAVIMIWFLGSLLLLVVRRFLSHDSLSSF